MAIMGWREREEEEERKTPLPRNSRGGSEKSETVSLYFAHFYPL